MARNTLEITGQTDVRNQVAPTLVQLKAEMDKHRAVWDRLTPQQRRRWVQLSEAKDPLLQLAYQTWRYLNGWFAESGGE